MTILVKKGENHAIKLQFHFQWVSLKVNERLVVGWKNGKGDATLPGGRRYQAKYSRTSHFYKTFPQ